MNINVIINDDKDNNKLTSNQIQKLNEKFNELKNKLSTKDELEMAVGETGVCKKNKNTEVIIRGY